MIEGLHYFREFESKKESEIKFWLPRYFPKRIRVIITADRNSKSYANLCKRKCTIIEVEKNLLVVHDILGTLQKKVFIMPKNFVDSFLAILKDRIREGEIDRTSVKILAAIFCPYETPGIYSKESADLPKIQSILTSIDFAELYCLLI